MRESDFVFGSVPQSNDFIGYASGNMLLTKQGVEPIKDWFCDTCNLVGYGNQHVATTIAAEAWAGMCHIPQFIQSDQRINASINLLGVSDMVRGKVFWSNSGTEAIETGMKLLRKNHWDEFHSDGYIVTIQGGFHGRTYESLAISSGMPEYYTRGFNVPSIFERKIAVITPDEEGIQKFKYYRMDDPIAGVIVEPFQGFNGDVRPLRFEFLDELAAECRRFDIPIMVDEIQSFARTDGWFAFEQYPMHPDIICLAKGIAGGLPCGVTIASEKFKDTLPIGSHYSTFGGSPLVCAAVNAVFSELVEYNLIDCYEKSLTLCIGMENLEGISEVRGSGFMLAVDTQVDAVEVGKRLMKYHNIHVCAIRHGHFKITPPLTITNDDIDYFLSSLETVLGGLL